MFNIDLFHAISELFCSIHPPCVGCQVRVNEIFCLVKASFINWLGLIKIQIGSLEVVFSGNFGDVPFIKS